MLNRKIVILFTIVYVLALLLNFWPAIIFPDGAFSAWGISASIVLLAMLIVYVNRSAIDRKVYFQVKVFLIVFLLVGAYIFIADCLLYWFPENIVVDFLAAIHYVLYVIAIIPFFSLNALLKLPYGMFSVAFTACLLLYFIVHNQLKKRMIK